MGSASKKEASKQTKYSLKPVFVPAVGICFIRRMALPIRVKQIFKRQISGKLKNNRRRDQWVEEAAGWPPPPTIVFVEKLKKKKSLDGLRQMLFR